MKKIMLSLLVIISFSLTGCLNLIEKISFNKDGSGEYQLTFDLSALYADPMLKSMVLEGMKSEMPEDVDMDEFMEFDTTIAFTQQMAQGFELERPEFWEKVSMDITSSESKQQLIASMIVPFKEVADIDFFMKSLNEMAKKQMGPAAGGNDILPANGLLAFSKKKLSRSPMPKPAQSMDMESQEMQMVKMMLATATYQTVYNLPGKVKKTTMEDAEIKENQVSITYPLLDLVEGKAKVEGDIKFKN